MDENLFEMIWPVTSIMKCHAAPSFMSLFSAFSLKHRLRLKSHDLLHFITLGMTSHMFSLTFETLP